MASIAQRPTAPCMSSTLASSRKKMPQTTHCHPSNVRNRAYTGSTTSRDE
jgi:hypothetical protein